MTRTIGLIVDGKPHLATIEERWTLIELLRSGLSLLETEEGCGEGACGSCSVLVDGELVRSCLYLAVRAEGRVVQTVASLATDDRLSPLQEAFVEHGAIQCGFCTPGFLMVASGLLDDATAPTENEIRERLSGNLCRCGGYPQIVAAIQSVFASRGARHAD